MNVFARASSAMSSGMSGGNSAATSPGQPSRRVDGRHTSIDRKVLDDYMPGWSKKGHKHITFRSEDFKLTSIDGLISLPIDLTHLESLDLSNNELTSLQPICLEYTCRLPALRVLKARRNRLALFEPVLPSLRELDLGHNELPHLPPMSGVPRLEILIVSHNKMAGTWEGLRQLESIRKMDISDNQYDFSPIELGEQLDILRRHMRGLQTLRLRGNDFTFKLPEYQAVVLDRVPQLQKLDDMDQDAMTETRKLAEKLGKIDSFNNLVAERRNARVHGHNPSSEHDVNILPSLEELSKPLSEALEDPDAVPKAIKQLVRLSDAVSAAPASRTQEIFRNRLDDKDKDQADLDIKAALEEFLGNFNVVFGRVEGNKANRAMLIRSVAKLGVVQDEFGMGTSCINCLGWLLRRSASDEAEILSTVREIIIDPLKYKKSSDQPVKKIISGLASFNSPSFPKYLSGLIEWLTKSYCDSGKQVDPEITRLMAIATSDVRNTEAALNYGSGSQEIGADVSSSAQMLLPKKVYDVVKCNAGLLSNPAQRPTYMHLLTIIKHMAHSGVQSVSKVISFYETKRFHLELREHLKKMFSEGSGKSLADFDLSKMKLLNIRTCAVLIDALVALMAQSKHTILNELVDDEEPSIVSYLLVAPKAVPVADPELLAASLSGLRLILFEYGRERPQMRQKMVENIVSELNKLEDILPCINNNSRKYNDLWLAAEKNLAEGESGSKKVPDAVSAPRFAYLLNPLVCRCFVSIVSLIEFFTKEGKNGDKLCMDVSEKLDEKDREKLLFALLAVPNSDVKKQVIECISEVDVGQMQSSDVGDLVNIVASSRDIAVEEELLEKVIDQLRTLMSSENKAKGGGIALRTEHAQKSIEAVLYVLRRNAQRRTYNDVDAERRKTQLSLACVRYLQTVSMNPDLRKAHMRTRTMTMALVQVLKLEDDLHSPHNVDIVAEQTWTGRSVETLLQCLAGVAQLRAQQKVAFRVISRIADVLEGRPDAMPNRVEDKTLAQIADTEKVMWEEGRVRRTLRVLSEDEMEDRDMQHEIFVKNSGIDRLIIFLTGEGTKDYNYVRRGLFADEETRAKARVAEAVTVQDAQDFLGKAMKNSEEQAEDERKALHDGGNDQGMLMLGDRSDSDSDISADDCNCLEFKGVGEEGNFMPGKTPVDLKKQPYMFNNKIPGVFSLAFSAKWDKHPEYATIIDWGSGAPNNNIVVTTHGSTYDLLFEYYDGPRLLHKVVVPDVIELHETFKFLITVNEHGHVQIWVNGSMKKESTRGLPLKDGQRKNLYVGHSNWPEGRSPFVGRISDLKYWAGMVYSWDDIQDDGSSGEESEPDGNETHPDRKLLMQMFMQVPDSTPPARPQVNGSASLSVATDMDLAINENPFRESTDGGFNPAFPVAATLRCCYAVLRFPAAESVKTVLVATLVDKLILSRLLSLVSQCGPFDCSVAAKLLKVMTLALEVNPTVVRQDASKIVIFELMLSYMERLSRTATSAIRQQENQHIADRGRALSLEITCLAATICQSVPLCTFSEDARMQEIFIEDCLKRLVPISLVQFILDIVMYDPQAGGGDNAFISEQVVKDMQGMNQLCEWSTQVLAQLLDNCPSMKYPVLELFGTTMISGTMPLRQSFVTGILSRTSQAKEKNAVQTALNNVDVYPAMPPTVLVDQQTLGAGKHAERTLCCANVDVFIGEGDGKSGTYLYVQDPSKAGACFSVVLTTHCMHLVDTTAKGFPERPTIVQSRRFCDMTRLVKGHPPQLLYVGFATRVRSGRSLFSEEYMMFVCHREKDRNDLLSVLTAQSQPAGGTFADRVPTQQDSLFRSALGNHVTEQIIRCSFALRGDLRLFVLSEGHVYEFQVHLEHWMPPVSADVDSDEEPDDYEEDPLAAPGRIADLAAESGKRGKGRKLAEFTPFQELTSTGDGVAAESGGGGAAHISSNRAVARGDKDDNASKAQLDRAKEGLLTPVASACQLAHLGRVAFFPDGRPKMVLTFTSERGSQEVPMLFLDDTTREQWRRGLMAQLSRNQASDSWTRSYESTRGRS